MAYNPNFIQNPYQLPFIQPQPAQNNGIIWVKGEAEAKAYPVTPGQSILLMDSDTSVFYIKSVDQSGMPLPLRIFDYTERGTDLGVQNAQANVEHITKEDFERFKEEIRAELRSKQKYSKGGQVNAQSSIPTT